MWLAALAALVGCSFTVQTTPPASDADGPQDTLASDGEPADAPSDAAMVDAPPPDAAFDPVMCPVGYATTVAASPGSRYRWIANNQPWLTHHQDCANDLLGATHLVVFGSAAEAQQIAAASSSMYYQVGAAQAPGQSSVGAGWFAVTGEPVAATLWHLGQPNDSNGSENSQQDRGSVNTIDGPLLQDVDATFATHGVCECDGKPVAPAVAAFL